MTFIRKSIAFARTAIASFFEADRHPLLGANDLDFYLFNREARIDEVFVPGISAQVAVNRSHQQYAGGAAAPVVWARRLLGPPLRTGMLGSKNWESEELCCNGGSATFERSGRGKA